MTDLIERLRRLNPWSEPDCSGVARMAADALAAQAAEIKRLTIECGMYKTAMEQSRKVLEDVEPRMYAAEAHVSDLSPEIERLRRHADIQQHNANANYGLWQQEKTRADALAARVADLEWVINLARNLLFEINPSNYEHDDVCRLNDASVEVLIAVDALQGAAPTDETSRGGA